jgi:hypothetical protein
VVILLADGQDASIFVQGSITAGGDLIITGNGNVASPSFKVKEVLTVLTTAPTFIIRKLLTSRRTNSYYWYMDVLSLLMRIFVLLGNL